MLFRFKFGFFFVFLRVHFPFKWIIVVLNGFRDKHWNYFSFQLLLFFSLLIFVEFRFEFQLLRIVSSRRNCCTNSATWNRHKTKVWINLRPNGLNCNSAYFFAEQFLFSVLFLSECGSRVNVFLQIFCITKWRMTRKYSFSGQVEELMLEKMFFFVSRGNLISSAIMQSNSVIRWEHLFRFNVQH